MSEFHRLRAPLLGAVMAAAVFVTGCSNSSVQTPGTSGGPSVSMPGGLPGGGQPGGSSSSTGKTGSGSAGQAGQAGQSGQSGQAGQAGQGAPGGQAGEAGKGGGTPGGMAGSGGAGTGGNDPQGAFDKSLGDFDGEIGRERDAMASAGKGSGRGAQSREAGDAEAVKKSSGSGGGSSSGSSGSPGDDKGAMGGDGGDSKGSGSGPSTDNSETGDRTVKPDDRNGAPKNSTGNEGKAVTPIPDDIPKDASGDTEVAKQIREAAEAEPDPHVRDALWDEYRKVTGISHK